MLFRSAQPLVREATRSLRTTRIRASHSGPSRTPHRGSRRIYFPLTILGVSIATIPFLIPSASADAESASASSNALGQGKDSIISRIPTSTLLRTYFVYTLCSFPWLVDHSTSILSTVNHIPGASSIVRNTFFAQFVGGETVEECVPLMTKLREDDGIGTLLAYSVEVEAHYAEGGKKAGKSTSVADMLAGGEGKEEVNEQVEETIRAIEVSGAFEREMEARTGVKGGTWVAVKIVSIPLLARA